MSIFPLSDSMVGELSGREIVRLGNCLVRELSGRGIFWSRNCPAGELSSWGIVRRRVVFRGIIRSGNSPSRNTVVNHWCRDWRAYVCLCVGTSKSTRSWSSIVRLRKLRSPFSLMHRSHFTSALLNGWHSRTIFQWTDGVKCHLFNIQTFWKKDWVRIFKTQSLMLTWSSVENK